MNTSRNLTLKMIGDIVASRISVEFSREDYRNNSGPIELEIWDGKSTVLLKIDPERFDKLNPEIIGGNVNVDGEDFKIVKKDAKKISLPNDVLMELNEFYNKNVEVFGGLSNTPDSVNGLSILALC